MSNARQLNSYLLEFVQVSPEEVMFIISVAVVSVFAGVLFGVVGMSLLVMAKSED